MAVFPLGGNSKDFDSKRSRETLVNLLAEASNDGTYRTVRRIEGILQAATFESGIPRSNIIINGEYAYLVAGTQAYRVREDFAVEDLGTVGGLGRAQLAQNSAPGGNQICILNGSGGGFIYTVGGALEPITDPDFFPTTSVTVLNERFWFSRDGTNEFFGSEVSDGLSYNPLTFGTAEESPDIVVRVIAKKSALWVVGSRTTQYYQAFNDPTFPLRAVKGVTKERGIGAPDSLAEIGEFFAYLADDGTIRLFTGVEMQKISSLEIELRIKGNGTLTYPGFRDPTDAVGFFIDGPIHKVYVLSFLRDGYTWCYDLTTGFDHERASEGRSYWTINSAQIFNNQVIAGDAFTGRLAVLDPDEKQEYGSIQRTTLRTPSQTSEKNITIPLIEIDMEVGQSEDPDLTPQMIVRYSKDGGYNYVNKGFVDLGAPGDYRKRVPLRRFGRLVRSKDFILELETTDPVRVQYYGAAWYPRIAM